MQDLKQHDTEKDPLDEYKGKWRNLWFSKSYGTTLGAFLYDSFSECELSGQGYLEKAKAGKYPYAVWGSIDIPCSDVTHFIPMPAK